MRYFGVLLSLGMILLMFMIIADAVSTLPTGFVIGSDGDKSGSCENACGENSSVEGRSCHCDESCASNGDCCRDFGEFCN